jgi:hypothetical protein
MSYSPFIASSARRNFQRFDGRFLPGLEAVGQGSFHPPKAPPIRIVCGRNVCEGCVERLGHPLRRAVRNVELSAEVLKADTGTAGCRHLGKAKQILRFGERNLTFTPEIDTFVRY